VNPLFEKAVQHLTGLTSTQVGKVIDGDTHVLPGGVLTDERSKDSATHGEGIERLLKKIDVDKDLEAVNDAIRSKSIPKSRLQAAYRKRAVLHGLRDVKERPEDVYLMKHLPVIPPKFRQVYPMPDGSLNIADPNHTYREVILINNQIKSLEKMGVDPENLTPLRAGLHAALMGHVGMAEPLTRSEEFKGFIRNIKGHTNKYGLFQSRVASRRQDLSGRSTIIAAPHLGMDELGIPWKIIKDTYKPFIVKKLVQLGHPALRAREMVEKDDPIARRAAELVVAERPTIANRAPTLHHFGILAFKPKITDGKAIELNPLVVGGLNADFDGDTLALHVPVSEEARKHALKYQLPSQNLLSTRHDALINAPTKEALLGIYLMTKPEGPSAGSYASKKEAVAAYVTRKAKINSPVKIGGATWTVGQITLDEVMPEGFKFGNKVVTASTMQKALLLLAQKLPKQAADVMNKVKDLGYHNITEVGWSVSLDDLKVDKKKRDAILADAAKEAKVVGFDKAYGKAGSRMKDLVKGMDTNQFVIGGHVSGALGKVDQVQRMIASPVAVSDHRGRVVQVPITRSFAEGHGIGEYWATVPGGRGGLIDKGLSTGETGALAKVINNATAETVITESDCRTRGGESHSKSDPEAVGHVLAFGEAHAGQIYTTDMAKRFRGSSVKVRTPFTCHAHGGLCQKCWGVMPDGQFPVVGHSIGLLASTAMSEPMTQMVLRNFHQGGQIGRKTMGYQRIAQILEMPENLPGKATIAMKDGTIKDMKRVVGGWNLDIDGHKHFLPAELEDHVHGKGPVPNVFEGQHVYAGKQLSRNGVISHRELLDATGDMDRVRSRMAEDMKKEFNDGGIGIRKKIIQTVLHPLTSRAVVEDPGDSSEFFHGDVVSHSVIQAHNADLRDAGLSAVKVRPMLLPVTKVQAHSKDFLGRLMGARLHETIAEAARESQQIDLDHASPITRLVLGDHDTVPEAAKVTRRL
jgi:DNA-directed RNA polymerase subunit beta'